MKRLTIILPFALFTAIFFGAAPADASPPRKANHWGDRARPIDPAMVMFEKKVRRGWQSGALTRHEIKKLEREKRSVVRLKRRALADGVLTRREYKRVRHAQIELFASVERQLHNQEARRLRRRNAWQWGYR